MPVPVEAGAGITIVVGAEVAAAWGRFSACVAVGAHAADNCVAIRMTAVSTIELRCCSFMVQSPSLCGGCGFICAYTQGAPAAWSRRIAALEAALRTEYSGDKLHEVRGSYPANEKALPGLWKRSRIGKKFRAVSGSDLAVHLRRAAGL